jgi:hypothetical protein
MYFLKIRHTLGDLRGETMEDDFGWSGKLTGGEVNHGHDK